MTTLECGHTFHVACALRWFRYHNKTCPNCRSCETRERWSRKTPRERVSIVRRRKHNPREVQRLLTHLDQVRTQVKVLRREYNAYRREHAHVFSFLRKCQSKGTRLVERERNLVRDIDRRCHTVPRMTRTGFVEEGSSDDSDEYSSSDE